MVDFDCCMIAVLKNIIGMPIDARISIHFSFKSDMHSELVKQYFLDHDYVNLSKGCISIVPRCTLQGVPVDAFVAGRGDVVKRAETFIVLFAKDTDILTHVHTDVVKVMMSYTAIQDIPQLLCKLCIQLYQMVHSSRPSRQRIKLPAHLLTFRAIPGVGKKKAELLHREYGTLRRFIDALHNKNASQLSTILAASHITRLRALFNVD